MRKIEYVVSNERLITPSGLSLVGQVLGKSNLVKKANRMRTEKRSQPQIKNGDILLTMIGLLALGKSDFENVNEFHTDLKEVQRHIIAVAVYERGLIAAEVSSVPADCFHPEKVNPDTAFCAEKHQGAVFSKNSQLGE
jgi:hypothetical protein